MMKKIYEQPKPVKDTVNSFAVDDKIDLKQIGLTEVEIKSLERIYIVAYRYAYRVVGAAKYCYIEVQHYKSSAAEYVY